MRNLLSIEAEHLEPKLEQGYVDKPGALERMGARIFHQARKRPGLPCAPQQREARDDRHEGKNRQGVLKR